MTYMARPPHCSIGDCLKSTWARAMCRMHYYRWRVHGDPNVVLIKQAPAGAPMTFLNALDLDGEGCVIWPFSRNNMGYGLVRPGGRTVVASRFSCERRNGPPPSASHQAAHSCNNGHLGCVAPWHLSWKTPRANMGDQVPNLRQTSHAWKLTAEKAEQIRALRGRMSQQTIANQFCITQSMVSRIFRGIAWRST